MAHEVHREGGFIETESPSRITGKKKFQGCPSFPDDKETLHGTLRDAIAVDWRWKKNEEILEEFFFWWISFVFIPLGNVSVVGLRRSTGTHRHSLKAEKWVTQKKGPVYAAMNNPKRPLVNPRFFCATWWSVSQIFPLSTLSLSIFPTRSLPFLSRSFVLDWSDPAANARAARESPWLATSHIAQIKKKSRKKKEIRTRPSRVLSMSWKLGTTQ